ncbi:hypothetical protein EGT07_18140 [Herbaspirillum sp. HC18]|nr:hypothetical protein EGT07_18140 [Herbaspirillum sp. HC18]
MTTKEINALSPAEMRALRTFRTIPEASRPQFFDLLETVCLACGWTYSEAPVLRAVQNGGQ